MPNSAALTNYNLFTILVAMCGAQPVQGATHLPIIHEASLCAAAALQYPSVANTERRMDAFEDVARTYRVSVDSLELAFNHYRDGLAAGAE